MDSTPIRASEARSNTPQPVEGPWYAPAKPIRYIHVDPLGAVQSVRLRHGLIGKRRPPVFKRVNDALFELSFNPGNVNRLEYEFELWMEDGTTQVIADPMNSLRVGDPFSEKSVTLLNGYAEPMICRPVTNGTAGSLRTIEIQPLTEDGPGEAMVWEPASVEPRDELPLLIVLDGGDYVRYTRLTDLLANMIADGTINRPGVRAVFLQPGDRHEEYSANPDMAQWLSEFVTGSLREHVPVPTDREMRMALGASLGGLCLLHAHVSHPKLFGGLILQSGSYFQPDSDWMEVKIRRFGRICDFVTRVLETPLDGVEVRACVTCGIGEENIANNQRMAARLNECGYAVRFDAHPDAHNWTSWRNCVGPAIASSLRH